MGDGSQYEIPGYVIPGQTVVGQPDNTVQIPPELDEGVGNPNLESWYGYLQRVDPFTVYLWHLKDYLAQMVRENIQKRIKEGLKKSKYGDETVESVANEEGLKAIDIYKNAIAMKNVIPLNMMPYYKESKGIEGETIKFQQNQVMRKQAIAKDIILSGVYTPVGRRKLAQAVQNRDFTEEDAYALNPDWQTYRVGEQKKQQADIEALKENVHTPEGRWKLTVAVSKGILTKEEAYDQNPYWQHYAKEESDQEALERENLLRYGASSVSGRMKLEQEVRAGTLSQEQAFGLGSQWEKQQHEQVEASGRGVPGVAGGGMFRNSPAQHTLLGKIREARALGIPSINEQDILQMNDNTAAAQAVALNEQIKLKQGQAQEMNQFRMGKLYPLGQGTPAQLAQETKLWRQYGDIYGQYRNYINQIPTMTDYRDIEQWIEERPDIKERIRRSAYEPSAPPAVYRRR